MQPSCVKGRRTIISPSVTGNPRFGRTGLSIISNGLKAGNRLAGLSISGAVPPSFVFYSVVSRFGSLVFPTV